MTLNFFFFNDTATTEIYTLSLHDALPISFQDRYAAASGRPQRRLVQGRAPGRRRHWTNRRSEEHTSELQSLAYLVCRLLLEKKKKKTYQCACSNLRRITHIVNSCRR